VAAHHLFIYFKTAHDSVSREVLYKNLIEFGKPMKLLRPIKLCPHETYSRVRVGKHLSDMFPVKHGFKQGDALSSLLFNFAFEYVVRRIEVNQEYLKLNGTNRILVYAGDNRLGGSVNFKKKHTGTSLGSSKETRPDVNAGNTKHMDMSRD